MVLTMKDDGSSCIEPSLFAATDRPVPRLDPGKDHLISTDNFQLVMYIGVIKVVSIMEDLALST